SRRSKAKRTGVLLVWWCASRLSVGDDAETKRRSRWAAMGRGSGMGNPVNVGIAVQAD
ncbi:unnamed protein product, partial [Urochloa humidicola]